MDTAGRMRSCDFHSACLHHRCWYSDFIRLVRFRSLRFTSVEIVRHLNMMVFQMVTIKDITLFLL